MASTTDVALGGLLAAGQPKPKAPEPAPAPQGPPPPTGTGGALVPASDEQIARYGLPPGSLEIKVPPSDPAFERVAAQAAAGGRQIVKAGDAVFAITPSQPQGSPVPGVQAPPAGGMPPGLIASAPAALGGGLLG